MKSLLLGISVYPDRICKLNSKSAEESVRTCGDNDRCLRWKDCVVSEAETGGGWGGQACGRNEMEDEIAGPRGQIIRLISTERED